MLTGRTAAAAQCGNVNGDAGLDLSDAMYLFQFLFLGGPAPRCGASGAIDGTLFEPLGTNAQGYEEYRHRQTGIVFVRLPGGTFRMGSDSAPSFYASPEHDVTVSPLLIAKYEVTQAQWTAFMGSNPSEHRGNGQLPVENISWLDAKEFCNRAGLRLPTEAEWEYACRAGTTTALAFGETLQSSDARFNSSSTTNVGSYAPNAFGLEDMHGNVREWCEDVYDEGFYELPHAAWTDPLATAGSGLRVIRGGSWDDDALLCRSASRHWLVPSLRLDFVGFRPARPLR